MDQAQVHFELFARKQQGSNWTLELATEERDRAIGAAGEMLADGRAAEVKVTKETLDEETHEFKSVTILAERAIAPPKPETLYRDLEPLCVVPQDLYTAQARARIGRLLGAWLAHNRVTPFELLHRADLIERLDASGLELRHAIQKIAIPEAQARGIGVHEVMRGFQRLAQTAIDRVRRDARKGRLPRLDGESFAALAERLAGEADRHYLLGAAVARAIGEGETWRDKVNRLLDLADAAPTSPPARALAFQVLEQPLAEVLESRAGVDELIGEQRDLGSTLAAMTRLAAADTVDALVVVEPAVAQAMPPLNGAAARLANWLDGPYFEAVRAAIAKRVLKELMGPRRLRPKDAEGEIIVLRALVTALNAAAGRVLSLDDVYNAFVGRSKTLIRADFVESYLGGQRTPQAEVEALLWLAENVFGAANKRQACRWVSANVGALRFETTVRSSPASPVAKLTALADLQRSVARAGFAPEDAAPIFARIGEVGGMIEADAQLTASLAKSRGPVLRRLTVLLRFAAGEAAPLGPAADRAKAEAIRLIRASETRAALAKAPEAVNRMRGLIQAAGLAA